MINLSKALKLKNKLIAKNTELMQRVLLYNSAKTGNDRPYSSTDSLKQYNEGIKELVDLKTLIHLANAEVYHKIFMMSELKSLASKLKGLDCKTGMHAEGWKSEIPVEFDSEISILEKDKIIASIEQEIENIQEALEEHNVRTTILP